MSGVDMDSLKILLSMAPDPDSRLLALKMQLEKPGSPDVSALVATLIKDGALDAAEGFTLLSKLENDPVTTQGSGYDSSDSGEIVSLAGSSTSGEEANAHREASAETQTGGAQHSESGLPASPEPKMEIMVETFIYSNDALKKEMMPEDTISDVRVAVGEVDVGAMMLEIWLVYTDGRPPIGPLEDDVIIDTLPDPLDAVSVVMGSAQRKCSLRMVHTVYGAQWIKEEGEWSACQCKVGWAWLSVDRVQHCIAFIASEDSPRSDELEQIFLNKVNSFAYDQKEFIMLKLDVMYPHIAKLMNVPLPEDGNMAEYYPHLQTFRGGPRIGGLTGLDHKLIKDLYPDYIQITIEEAMKKEREKAKKFED